MIPKIPGGHSNAASVAASDFQATDKRPTNRKERLKVSRIDRTRITAVFAAVALTAVFAAPATAQVSGHDHAAVATSELTLNQGRKWPTDKPLREGMDGIRGLVEPQLRAAHAGKLGSSQYQALARQIESHVGGIVANCKLEPKADAMLHLVIADIGAGIDAMTGKNAKVPPAQGLVKIAQAVNAYGGHFDHPGFKPIHDSH